MEIKRIGIVGQGFVGSAVREGLKPYFDIVTYDKFKTFAIKIVLGSASTSIIPKVKDMKAVALDF